MVLDKKHMQSLEILYQDEDFIAVNKPSGILVHRTAIAKDATEYVLQRLRDQVNRFVFPVHRLDRKTSGVLLFAFNKETTRKLQKSIEENAAEKKYLAIVRGYFPERAVVDRSLVSEKGKEQNAVTHFFLKSKTELPIAYGKYKTSRYSLIEVFPKTGRMHQIRRHLNHLRHPIIADRVYGCNKQNRLFKDKWSMVRMLLHASEIKLPHPTSNKYLSIEAPLPTEFERVLHLLGL